MNTFSILTAQIGMFVIYMIAGVILIRTRVMNRENLEVISKFVIKLALPVMIFINTDILMRGLFIPSLFTLDKRHYHIHCLHGVHHCILL